MNPDPASPAPALTPGDWERFLSQRLSRRVCVAYGRSRTTPLQFRRDRRAWTDGADWHVRMHSMFASAPLEVRSAVVDLLAPGSKSRPSRSILEDWITASLAKLPRPKIPDAVLWAQGQHHDLAAISLPLIASEFRRDFESEVRVPRLTWGRSQKRRRIRSIRLGSYDVESHLVRIHPALDQAAVPEWFVRYVLFHEYLHAVHPPVRAEDGRWIRHGPAFLRRERSYADLERALAWERANIDRLIRSARTGKPMRTDGSSASAAIGFIQGLLFPERLSARSRPGRRARA